MKPKTIKDSVLKKLKNRKPIKCTKSIATAVCRLRKEGVKINTVKKMIKGVLVTQYYYGYKI